MTALLRLKEIDRQLERKVMQAEALKASLLPRAIRYDGDKVQTSPRDYVLEVMAKIDELNAEINALSAKKTEYILQAIAEVERIPGELEKEILTAYYIKGERVRHIARRMHYSREGIYKILQRGIDKLESL